MLFYYYTWFLAQIFFIQKIWYKILWVACIQNYNHCFAHKLSLVIMKSQATFLTNPKTLLREWKHFKFQTSAKLGSATLFEHTKVWVHFKIKFKWAKIRMTITLPSYYHLHYQCPLSTAKSTVSSKLINCLNVVKVKGFLIIKKYFSPCLIHALFC